MIFTCLSLERGQYCIALNSGQTALRYRSLYAIKCPTKIMISCAYFKIKSVSPCIEILFKTLGIIVKYIRTEIHKIVHNHI